jgi:hypothetical protein
VQAGVDPGGAAWCAEHYPPVFEAWLEALDEVRQESEREQRLAKFRR